MPTKTPPQVVDFYVVSVPNLNQGGQGHVKSSQKSLSTHRIEFDWAASQIRHNRLQVAVVAESFAKSVGSSFCVDMTKKGAFVGVFHSGDLSSHTLGVHEVRATAFTSVDCKTGPGPTATLKLAVSYGKDTAATGCSRGYIVGITYRDKKGRARFIKPRNKPCIAESKIEALAVSYIWQGARHSASSLSCQEPPNLGSPAFERLHAAGFGNSV